jgi:hypothetical protein
LEGRVKFIEEKKKAYYENKHQPNNSSDNKDTSHDEDNISASVDKDGFTLTLSKEKVQAIQATVRDLEYQSSDNEDISSASLTTLPEQTTLLVVNGIEHECSPETAQAIKEVINDLGPLAGDSYEEEWIEVANESSAKQQAKLAKAAYAAELAAQLAQLAQAAQTAQATQATQASQDTQPMIEA